MKKINSRFKDFKGVSDIVNAMILGLKREWVKVNMDTFGEIIHEIPCGCAATNALCEIMGNSFSKDAISLRNMRAFQFSQIINNQDYAELEFSVDMLRRTYFITFIKYLQRIKHLFPFRIPKYSEIKEIEAKCSLVILDNINYNGKELEEYEKLRDLLIQKEKTFIFRFKNWKYNTLRKIGIIR